MITSTINLRLLSDVVRSSKLIGSFSNIFFFSSDDVVPQFIFENASTYVHVLASNRSHTIIIIIC